jgi:hTAFII28-like protein conserved region
MSAKQVEQFEAYRRSGLKAAAVRKVSTWVLRIICDCHLTDSGAPVAGSTHRSSN